MRSLHFIALVPSFCFTFAAYQGFNYDAAADFQNNFISAKNLVDTNSNFSSARLYTSIESGTTNSPSAAFDAAVNTGTSLLLGLWASDGQTQLDNEMTAIRSAFSQYGTSLTDLIAGISVGSEDVYRITPLGIASQAGPGVDPATVVNYISQVRSAFSDLGKPIGHVDTYNVWSNISGWMSGVASACDFIGMDAYPYYESTKANSIGKANITFWGDYQAIVGAVDGKPIWITETGWPTSGSTINEAVSSVDNAHTYYQEVGCSAFAAGINTWWYTFQDSESAPSFGVVGYESPLPTIPKYSLAC